MRNPYPYHDAPGFTEPTADEIDCAIAGILTDFDRRGYDSWLGERITEESPREAFDVLVQLGRLENDSLDLEEIEHSWSKFLRAEAGRMIRAYDPLAWTVWRQRRAGR